MNVAVLHNFVTAELAPVQPLIDPVFRYAKSRAQQGHRTNSAAFIAALHTRLQPFHIAVKLEVDDAHDPQYYPPLGGWCYESNKRILLTVGRPSHSARFDFTPQQWDRFHYRFYKFLAHELTHRAQYTYSKRRSDGLVFRPHASALGDKTKEQQQRYLGDIDEIEAYARGVVEEWYYTYPTPLTMREIRRDFRTTRELPTLEDYWTAFDGDETHPAIQRLFRKVKAWNGLLTPIAESLGFWETSAQNTRNNTMRESAPASSTSAS